MDRLIEMLDSCIEGMERIEQKMDEVIMQGGDSNE